jgi:hypothetical protein
VIQDQEVDADGRTGQIGMLETHVWSFLGEPAETIILWFALYRHLAQIAFSKQQTLPFGFGQRIDTLVADDKHRRTFTILFESRVIEEGKETSDGVGVCSANMK